MKSKDLVETLKSELAAQAEVRQRVGQSIRALKISCSELIDAISNATEENAESYFDELWAIQGVLSKAVFVDGVNVDDDLMSLIREFERLHDPNARSYWYQRIQAGEKWPTSPTS